MNGQEKSDPAIVAERPTNEAERSASEPAEPRAGAEGKTLRQSAFRTQGRVDASQALERIRQAATLRRQSPEVGAVCGNRARTVLCGGRSAMSVPTAFYSSESGLFNGLRRIQIKRIWLPSQTLREMSQAVSTFLLGPPLARRGFDPANGKTYSTAFRFLQTNARVHGSHPGSADSV